MLSHANQKGGFDCPGCAWPDPDDERSAFEYCENGAKAVAEEATTRRVDPEFFAAHPVADLLEQAVTLARKRAPQLSGDRESVRRRLAAYLERRGFPVSVCRAAVDDVAPF